MLPNPYHAATIHREHQHRQIRILNRSAGYLDNYFTIAGHSNNANLTVQLDPLRAKFACKRKSAQLDDSHYCRKMHQTEKETIKTKTEVRTRM